MKTFEELKNQRLQTEKQRVASYQEDLKNEDLSDNQKGITNFFIRESMRVIENIDEVIKMEIAYNTNSLYNGFKWYISHGYLIFLTKTANIEEILKNEIFLDMKEAILYFGFSYEELNNLMFNIFDGKSRDTLVKFINDRYKTNIPLTIELEKAKQKILEVCFGELSEKNLACKEYSLLKLNNGEYLRYGEYPLYYQTDIITQYSVVENELIQEGPKLVKKQMPQDPQQ